MNKSKMMTAAVWHGLGDLRVEERRLPEVIPGSVLVKVDACAVCGSDLRIFKEGNARITEPRIIGHEIAGEIHAVGTGVGRFKVGDRVSVGADIPCGQCQQCRLGRANCCETNLALGYQFDGGFAEFVRLDPIVVELGPVEVVGNGIPLELAALAEPLACCINGYERTFYEGGGTIVVFGAGPIGLMLAIMGRYYGAERIVMVEPSTPRRNAAEQGVADVVVDPTERDPVATIMEITDGAGADVVFTACPIVDVHEQAVAMIARRGVVNLFGGLPKDSRPISLNSNHIHYREAYVTGSHGSTPAQHKRALELIVKGEVDVSGLVTHRIPIEEIHDGIATAMSGDAIKVIVKPGLSS